MLLTDKICKYATLQEATRPEVARQYGTDNQPTPEHLENLKYLGLKVFDPVREFVGGPLHGFWYRNAIVNAATPGASKFSQHMLGQAVDIDCDVYKHGTNRDVFNYIVKNLEFDQIIWEAGTDQNPDWVHVSIIHPGKGINRRKITRMTRSNGQPVYSDFKVL